MSEIPQTMTTMEAGFTANEKHAKNFDPSRNEWGRLLPRRPALSL